MLREGDAAGIFFRIVGDDGDALDAFGAHLPRDHVDRQPALVRLAAGHGHGIVIEDLEGDVGAACQREADGEHTGVVIGAVAEILEKVIALRERRLADPLRPLPAHGGEADGRAVHPQRHEVAADPGGGDRAFRHLGRRIMRASGAEEGRARADVDGIGEHRLELAQAGDARGNRLRMADRRQDALTQRDGDVVGVKRTLGREQPVAALVLLADDFRLDGRAIEIFAQLHLDQRALFLHHDHGFEAAREIGDVPVVERPRAADLEQADAEPGRFGLVDAEVVQRLAHIEIALADGDDADARRTAALVDQPVQPVGMDEGADGGALIFV